MIGLDTTAIIDLFRGEPAIKRFLERSKEPLATNIINHLEVHFGIEPSNPKHQKEAAYYDEFFRSTYFFTLTREASRRACELHWQLKKRGTPISKLDSIIAACFLENGVRKILTRNARHFTHIKELKVVVY